MAPWLLRYPMCPKRALQFSLCFLNKAPFGLPPIGFSSYSRVAVSSVFWAHNIFFSAQTRGAPLKKNQSAPRPLEHPPVMGELLIHTFGVLLSLQLKKLLR